MSCLAVLKRHESAINAPLAMNGYTTPPLTPQPKKPPTLKRNIRMMEPKPVDKNMQLFAKKLKRLNESQPFTDGAEHANELPDFGDLAVAAVALAP
jgi:hypothetical protein